MVVCPVLDLYQDRIGCHLTYRLKYQSDGVIANKQINQTKRVLRALYLKRTDGNYMPHPEKDYWRMKIPINKDLRLNMEDEIKIIKGERKLLLEFEIEEQDKY